ncbi:MAG TPA: hypothetical protein VK851_15215 [Anaerolineales bacterium]|nr:hypothetical protein [Anaerolineales bacterium]
MAIDVTNWIKFGQTSNAEFYEISPGFLAVVPFNECTDDETTAKASVQTQLNYLRSKNHKAAVVIFMDNIVQQTAGARAVYRDMPDPMYQACFALVGGTVFGRAVGSVFLGLSKPRVPTQMFGTLEQALAWCHSQVKKVD